MQNVFNRISDNRFICRDGYIFRYACKFRSIPREFIAVHVLGRGDIRQIRKVKHFARNVRKAVLLERYRVRSAGYRHFHGVVCRELVVLVRRQSSGSDIFARFYHFAVIAYRQLHAVAVYKVGRLDGNRLLCLAVIFECGFAVKRKREFALFNRQRCRLVCNEFIVLAIAFERCRYFIFASVDLVIARVLRGHAVGQVRRQDRMRLPVVGYGFIRKDNTTHIVNGFFDCQRCRQFGQVRIIAVGAGKRCCYGIGIRVDLFVILVFYFNAFGKFTCNIDRFFRAVIGKFAVIERNARQVACIDFERCRHIRDWVIVLAVALEDCRYSVFTCLRLIVILVSNRHTVRQVGGFKGIDFARVVHALILKHHARHIVGSLFDEQGCREFGQVGVVAVRAGKRRRDDIGIRVDLFVIFVFYFHAVGKRSRDEDGFFCAVIGKFAVVERNARQVTCADDEFRRHIGNCVIVRSITREMRRYGIFARLRLIVSVIGCGNAVRQIRRFDRVCFARVVHALILEHHTRHIVGGFIDFQGCLHIRKVVVVRIFRERCRYRVFARIRVARFLVVGNGHAVGERSRNSKRFFRAVVGVFRTRKGYARYRCFVDSERCRLVCNQLIVLAIACEFCRYRVRIGVDFSVIFPIHGKTARQARYRYGMRLPVVGRFGVFKANIRHIIGCLVDCQGCRFACNRLVVCTVARERCLYFIFASIDLTIARVLRSYAVRQIRCFNRVRLPIVGHGFVRKDNRAHIIGRLVDSERCRQFNGVVIYKGNGCFNRVFACVRVACCLIVRHLRARRQTCNGKRFCRSVVGCGYIVKGYPCKIVIFERYRPRAGHAFITHRQSVRADGGKFGVIFRREIVCG